MTKPIDAFRNFANKPQSCCTFVVVVVVEMHLWLIKRNSRLMRHHCEACQFNRVTLSGKPAVWHWRGTTVSTESLFPPLYKNTSNQQSHFLSSFCLYRILQTSCWFCFLVLGGTHCGSLTGPLSTSPYDRRNGKLMELFWRWVCRNTLRSTCLSVPLSTINPTHTSLARSRQPTAWAMTHATKSLLSRTAVCPEF